MTGQTITPTRLDLARGDSRIIVAMGPVRVPPNAELSAELLRLASISTGNRLGIVRVEGQRHWRHEPDALVDAVLDFQARFPGTAHLPIADKLALLQGTTATPDGLRIYVTDTHLITDIPHAVFDGVMVVSLWLYLTRWQPGSTPDWATAAPLRPHLGTALARHLARSPRSVVELARAGRRPSASISAPASNSAVRVAQSGEPELRTRSAAMNRDALAALREWRDTRAPGCSMAVILMTVLTRAMTESGISTAPHIHVVVDGRRYDRRLRTYLGNAAVGLNLAFAPPHRPDALQSELSRAVGAGRPLAAMLAISFGQFMSGHRRSTPEPASADAGTVLSFSHLLGLDTMPDGHWIGGFDAHDFTALSEPVDEAGIAFLMPKMRDRYDLSASFDIRHHDPATIEHALDLATADTLALLDRQALTDREE